jgi:hypothetical protein
MTGRDGRSAPSGQVDANGPISRSWAMPAGAHLVAKALGDGLTLD